MNINTSKLQIEKAKSCPACLLRDPISRSMSPSLWTRILLLVVFFDIDLNLGDILTLSVSLSEAAAEI